MIRALKRCFYPRYRFMVRKTNEGYEIDVERRNEKYFYGIYLGDGAFDSIKQYLFMNNVISIYQHHTSITFDVYGEDEFYKYYTGIERNNAECRIHMI